MTKKISNQLMEGSEGEKLAMGNRILWVVKECYDGNQSACAKDIGITKGSLSIIVQGKNYPSFKAIRNLLAKNPSISPDWLILGKGPSTREVNENEETLKRRIEELESHIRRTTEAYKKLGL